MSGPFLRKLEGFATFSRDERQMLKRVTGDVIRRPAGHDLIRQGERPQFVHILLEGWAYRYKLLPDGSRQIMAYLIPGDLCDIHIFILKRMDHSIGLLSDAKVALVPEPGMRDLLENYPGIARALFWAALVDEATLREWLANTLRRPPLERMAHLFSELWMRMAAVDLVRAKSFDLPLTQAELGDTIGLNSVTVNRVLQRLRAQELITLDQQRLTIVDIGDLMRLCSFDSSYLHLPAAPREVQPL